MMRAMRIAILSTYPPRACGIGTFSFDVRTALLDVAGVDDVDPLAVVDEPRAPQRPEILRAVSQGTRGDYVRAARMLSRTDVDVVLLQHEYGIFGGRDGEYVLSFARELAQPLVVTLHTVLSEPTAHQLEVLTALCDEAERVIVLTETARRLLTGLGACDDEKIRVVPHGAPVELGARRAEQEAGRRPQYVAPVRGGYEHIKSRFLLSTFGLISPGKGLETMIDALPELVERHPEVLYLIAGRTHPQVARRAGEEYRLKLERRVVDLGMNDHVEFDDRFLSIDELADLLAATDVFVTPYLGREQIASGALTFAIAAGCATVSTPYWYAADMLASGAGTLVPFGDAAALTEAVSNYRESPEALAAARREARRLGSELAWPSVAEATAAVLLEATEAAPRRTSIPDVELELAETRTDHLLTLVDDCGIVQHAHGAIPNRGTGYCVDDVARLLVVALELEQRTGDRAWMPIVYRSLAFLCDAAEGAGTAGMRNFMGYDRRWLDEPHLGDHVGRAVWALGDILSTAWVPAAVEPSRRLLAALVGSLECRALRADGRLRDPRPRPPRQGSTRSGSRIAARSLRHTARSGVRRDRRRRLALVRGQVDLRQRPAPACADRRRDGRSAATRRWTWVSSRSPGSATSAGSARACCGSRGISAGAAASPRRAAATSSRSMPRRWSRQSSAPSRSRTIRSTGHAPSARSNGSWDEIGSACRSTTSPPAAAATGSARKP